MTDDTHDTDDSTDAQLHERIDELEDLVEKQAERIEELEAENDSGGPTFGRRTMLKGVGVGGLLGLGLGSGQASAAPQGQVGTSSTPINVLYTDKINGPVTGGTEVTSLTGTGLAINSGNLDIASGGVGASQLDTPFADLSTLFGSPVSAGATLDLVGNDLVDGGTTIWDSSNGQVPTARLENSSLTVAGNSVSLGGSTGIAHGDLSTAPASAHHNKPSAGDGLTGTNTFDINPADFAGSLLSEDGSNNLQVDEGSISHDNIDQLTVSSGDHHTKPSAGVGLTGTNTFDVDLSSIAGDNISADTTNNELDVSSSINVNRVSISELGAAAELTSDLAISDTPTDVVYNQESVDDRAEYDTSNGKFTCAYAGDYHVEAQVIWEGTLSEGEFIRLAIRVNGSTSIAEGHRWPTSTSSGETITQSVSGTLRNLSETDTIKITAQTGDDTTTHNIRGLARGSNLQISQIG